VGGALTQQGVALIHTAESLGHNSQGQTVRLAAQHSFDILLNGLKLLEILLDRSNINEIKELNLVHPGPSH
jgi:hypothetical protein